MFYCVFLSIPNLKPTIAMSAPTQRFTALDIFRGMTICFMIIVNTPGGPHSYAPLEHAHWNGFTPTDLVFPSFLFAVGNAMSFVMPKWQGKANSWVVGKIIKRTVLIFLLGYLMYWFPFFHFDAQHQIMANPIAHTRIMGVLQRIALCYGIASLLIWFLKPKTALYIGIALLFVYWAIMYYLGDPTDPYGMTTNAGYYLDVWLMGPNHMYHGEGVAFDPEGWLSTMPAIANVIAGYMAGAFIQKKGNTYETLTKLLLVGFGLLVLSYFWNLSFPINKKLWTSAFVLHTVGLDCMIIATVMYFVTFQHWGEGKLSYFFQVFGKNPLFIYLLSELLVTVFYMIPIEGYKGLIQWLYTNVYSYAGEYLGSFLFAISYMLLCWVVGYYLDKRKIYVRV
jgi:predicted acyltransferase